MNKIVLQNEQLDPNLNDGITSLIRVASNQIPIAGPILAEIFGLLVPNQQLDRVVDCIKKLCERVGNIESVLEDIKKNELKADIFIETMRQASQSLSEERRSHLANILRNSLSEESFNYSGVKKFLSLFAELDDVEIILLRYYAFDRYKDVESKKAFSALHSEIIEKPVVYASGVPDAALSANLYEARLNKLLRIGLLNQKIENELKKNGNQRVTIKEKKADPRISPVGKQLVQLFL